MIMLEEILSHNLLVTASEIFRYKVSQYLGFVSNGRVKADHQIGGPTDPRFRDIRSDHGLSP